MAELLDSGERRGFDTGAVRDISTGKGRCDLLPLDVVAGIIQSHTLMHIDHYIRNGNLSSLRSAIRVFIVDEMETDMYTGMLEAAKQYEDGARKYGDRNWELGQPLHVFIDCAVRHYLKFLRRDDDEPHDRAFIWNILCAFWTHMHKPELIDLPFIDKEDMSNEKSSNIK